MPSPPIDAPRSHSWPQSLSLTSTAIERPLTSIPSPAVGQAVRQAASSQPFCSAPNQERASTRQSPCDQSFRLVTVNRALV
jgi:hypothetical protein